MKILIVEDDRRYRAMLFDCLSSLDHDVLAVADAIHAVALLNESDNGIDLVLLDLKMPRMGGGMLLKTFANWKQYKARFVVVSGTPDFSQFNGHPAVVACLHKPFPISALKEVIDKAAQESSGPRPVMES
jgi:CheY-like chemotaxis protein